MEVCGGGKCMCWSVWVGVYGWVGGAYECNRQVPLTHSLSLTPQTSDCPSSDGESTLTLPAALLGLACLALKVINTEP